MSNAAHTAVHDVLARTHLEQTESFAVTCNQEPDHR